MELKVFYLYICIVAISFIYLAAPVVSQIENPERRCESTGPLCQVNDSCQGLADGLYQWCGACNLQARCLEGVLAFFETHNPDLPYWDDHKKNWEVASTTCHECYYECPAGSSVPPKPTVPQCDSTGLGCIPDPSFCGIQPPEGFYQYCGNCSHYVYCHGRTSNLPTLHPCPGTTKFDRAAGGCLPQSSTCVECYEPCLPPVETTQSPTTEPPEEEETTEDPQGQHTTTIKASATTSRQSVTVIFCFTICIINVLKVAL